MAIPCPQLRAYLVIPREDAMQVDGDPPVPPTPHLGTPQDEQMEVDEDPPAPTPEPPKSLEETSNEVLVSLSVGIGAVTLLIR